MTKQGFSQKVYQTVCKIPYGQVATYGQIAALIGQPTAGRAVGMSLHFLPPLKLRQCPWWRVVNAQGFISTTCRQHTYKRQMALLVSEGVRVIWRPDKQMYWLNLQHYLWRPLLLD